MTTYQQIKKIMEGKNGQIISSASLKNEMKTRFGVKPGSVIPSDYCYNRINDGIKFQKIIGFLNTLAEASTNTLASSIHIPVKYGISHRGEVRKKKLLASGLMVR